MTDIHGHLVALAAHGMMLAVLAGAAGHDHRTRLVPNRYPAMLLVIGLAANWFLAAPAWYLSGALVALPFAVAWRRGGTGGADVKIVAALGLSMHPRMAAGCVIAALAMAVLAESCGRAIRRRRGMGGRDRSFPFVTYMFFAYGLLWPFIVNH